MFVDFSIWRRYVIVLHDSPDFATIQLVECIGLVHIQALDLMVIDMKMTVMEAGRKIEVVMAMAEKKNGAIETMISIVVTEIVMAEIMRNAIAEMVTGMMSTVEVLTMTNMAQETGDLIETMIIILMMMVSVHLGVCLYLNEITPLIYYSFI